MTKIELMLRAAILVFLVNFTVFVALWSAAAYVPVLPNLLAPAITFTGAVALMLIPIPIIYYSAISPFALSQTNEKDQRVAELLLAYKEKDQRAEELIIANKEKDQRVAELVISNEEKDQRAEELVIANKEKDQRAEELVIANEEKDQRVAELVISNKEKDQRGEELVIANKEKDQRAEELVIANKEKDQRAEELVIANEEKDQRAEELVIANKEKDQRAEELVIANEEKDQRVAELVISNKEKDQRGEELVIANKEKDQRVAELVISNKEKDLLRKETNRTKSEFISTVSHELRTPLTAIKAALGLIQSGVFDKNPEKLPSTVGIAYKNADRLHLLIDDILDIEMLNVGKMNFHMESVDVSSLVEEATLSIEAFGSQYGVTFVYSGTDELLYVNGDYNRLIQVIANLLSNATKFSHRDGQVDVFLARHNGNIRVSVQDYGRGIPESARASIFDNFTQVDSSDRRNRGGSGLGLSIAKKIVEAHDGHIDFISEVDKGTTFYFDLPEFLTSQA
jgi:signal transduction histidine kinase